MIEDKRVKKLLNEMQEDCIKDVGLRYPDNQGNGKLFSYAVEVYNDIIKGTFPAISSERVFKTLQDWYLDNSYYQLLKENNTSMAIEYFTRSSAYGYLALFVGEVNFFCPSTPGQSSYLMDTATAHMSQTLLCGWESEYSQIGDWFIDSIAFGKQKKEGDSHYSYHAIISGESYALAGWFLVDLYCMVYGKQYDESKAIRPDDLLFYKDVLKNWDTNNIQEVQRLVSIMSEYHMDQTQEEKGDDDYYSFSSVNYWLFPYEILTWLKLRELKGLKNPKTFTHPLMNTPIAKMFLNIKEPLPYPKELPYAKELLEKLQEQCPDVEIPEWLEGVSGSVNKRDNTIGDDLFIK